MTIRYVTQPSIEEGKIVVFPVDDEITFTDKEKEVLKLAIEDIRTGWTGCSYVTNSIGFCGDPCVPMDASTECQLAIRKVDLLIERCDPQYKENLRKASVLYVSLDQANHQYMIQQNDLHLYPKFAPTNECAIAWFNYLIEHC
jgi:hypothetical protein